MSNWSYAAQILMQLRPISEVKQELEIVGKMRGKSREMVCEMGNLVTH